MLIRDIHFEGRIQRNENIGAVGPSYGEAIDETGFAGCIPGIHEVLQRQGLMDGTWCLNPHEELSPGQLEEIDRIYREYPHLNDDDFVRSNLKKWLGE